MKTLNAQFHMLPEEMVNLLDEAIEQGNVFISDLGIIGEFHPQVYSGDRLLEQLQKGFVFIALSERKPDFACRNQKEFNALNPGSLYFTLGSKMDLNLNESALSGFIEDDAKLLIRFFNGFKKGLNRGCTICNPDMETKALVKNHFYSDGAAKFQFSGGSLRAPGGTNYYIIEK